MPNASRVASRYLPGKVAARYLSLQLRPDYGESDAALPRGEDTPVSKQAFNKENPVDLLAQLVKVLEKEGLDDAAQTIRTVSRDVNRAWAGRER